jgi:lipopolysaccharide transport system ATP-binding protein
VVIVENLGKRFWHGRLYRPSTLQEAFVGRFQKKEPGGAYWALRDVTFRVEPGRVLGIVGSNGAGKSTLLRLLSGIGRPDTGTVRTRGRVNALLDMAGGFHHELTGRENVLIGGILAGLRRKEVARRMDAIVEFSQLQEFIDEPLRTYSNGMRMRLAFALSLAVHTGTDVLILDEVLAVGDAAFQKRCLEQIRRFRESGSTVVLVGHDPGTVSSISDDALWLRDGEVRAIGAPAEVIARYEEELALRS